MKRYECCERGDCDCRISALDLMDSKAPQISTRPTCYLRPEGVPQLRTDEEIKARREWEEQR